MNNNEEILARGMEHHKAGRLDQAEADYRRVLSSNTNDVDALYLLARIKHGDGDNGQALELLEQALVVEPDNLRVIRERGLTLLDSRRLEQARDSFERALELEPDSADTHYNLGCVLQQLKDYPAALSAYQNALAHKPDYVQAYHNTGIILSNMGRVADAVHSYSQVIDIDPEYSPVYLPLCEELLKLGKYREAADMAVAVLAHQPDNFQIRQFLIKAMRGLDAARMDGHLIAELQNNYASLDVNHQGMADVALRIIMANPVTQRVLSLDDAALRAAFDDGSLEPFYAQPLLLEALAGGVLADLELEGGMRRLRRLVLHECTQGGPAAFAPSLSPFIVALGVQCFLNEYIFPLEVGDRELLAELKGELERRLESDSLGDDGYVMLSIYALYAPLYSLRGWERIDTGGRELFMGILAQCEDYAREMELRSSISSFSAITDKVSMAVQAQYEESPYPRWFVLDRQADGTLPQTFVNPYIKLADPDLLHHPKRILVAGCGTGQQPIFIARFYPDVEVTALDLSRTSLAYAMRKAEEMGVENIRFRHGDILELADSDERYDLVFCSGVLHHMQNPMAGWRALRHVLAEAGAMSIALYSSHARSVIYEAREKIAALGLDDDLDTIRAARLDKAIINTDDEKVARFMLKSLDYFSLSGFRDLVFHRQEHGYTLPEIGACLDELRLRFVGIDYTPALYARFFAERGRDAAVDDISQWDAFELKHPDAFVGMYSFWCEPLA